jgi:hypothetical protein
VLKGESLTSLYDAREATVLTGGDDFTWFELDRRSTVGATKFLNHRHFADHSVLVFVSKVQQELFRPKRRVVARFNTRISDK